jgi:hydroxyethylthiazole kinase-like uncharacterized protein yjeF
MPHQLQLPASNQILTVAQMRAAEDALIAGGTGVDELMQRAGRGAGEYVRRIAAGHSVTVLCGPGNNGGDGYVIAQHLREHGNPVRVIAAREPATAAARNARALYHDEVLGPDARVKGDVLVDCLFGSGLTRALPNDLLVLLTGLAAAHHHRIAIDLPSGIESDSGQPLNPDLPHWDLTIALGAWKFAHWTMPACAAMGALRLVPIGCDEVPGAARLLAWPGIAAPAVDAHKYRRGLLGVIGGTMPGAALLAASAAQRAGAGYVKLLGGPGPSTSSGRAELENATPESAQAEPVEAPTAPADLVTDNQPLPAALADKRWSALLVGPGLGRDGAARARLGAVLARKVPTVIDADALVLLDRPAPGCILTPHEGELTALEKAFGLPGEGPRRARALALAKAAQAVVVAKGPDTAIAAPTGELVLAPRASSWLSVAGTGDVLAGMIASRLAVHGDALRAAQEGVWLHGEAARLAGPAFTAGELARQGSQALLAALG